MTIAYTEKILREVFKDALDSFNDCLDSSITQDNTLLVFFTPETGIEIYQNFCSQYFPNHLREPYMEDGYFESFAAQAFVGEKLNGILFRSDLDFSLAEIHYTFLHEISHIYCTRHEIPGGHFFDRFCMGSGVEDGMMNAGYAIWREAIADIMTSSIISETTGVSLSHIRKQVLELYNMISPSNPDSKKCMSLIITYIMNAKEVAGTEDWLEAERSLKHVFDFGVIMMSFLEQVFINLHTSPFWSITPEFIMDLGEKYLLDLSFKTFPFQNINQ